ncbi:ABC transporter ATP-binding protein [Prosthecomicrobium sp. N25]|uniref:ABC transporter ATP-binding protein n=1 Tax=Prosthecomicrobium sp. N25 TaxID=3129254 RepID=UPI0030771C1D
MLSVGESGRLEVRIDRKTYHSARGQVVEAVRGLEFSVPAGEFACLIGPSGCGKSTTLRILLGLDRDFEGSVRLPAGGGRVGVMFQEPRLLPWRTVEENVRLTLPAGLAQRSLDDLFAELDLEDARSRYTGELSLGMERRVALARALALDPDLLILDEPLVSLDDHTAARLRRLIAAATERRHATVLMVTHNVREALELADTLVLLAPRPTRVIGTVQLDRPKGDRPVAWLESTRADLARRFPGTIAE